MQNKKAAMEMSVGTIVTIVLLMSVLVLGVFLIGKIFASGEGAIREIDQAVQNEINKLFNENEDTTFVLLPQDRGISIKRGSEDEVGFLFAVENELGAETQSYTYNITAYEMKNCGNLTLAQAQDYLISSKGTFTLRGGDQSDLNNGWIKFDIPKNSPVCKIVYIISVEGNKGQIEDGRMLVSIRR